MLPRGGRIACLVAAALSVLPAACRGPQPPPLHPGEPVTDAQRTAAMVSIQAHARWLDADLGGLFITLPEAVEILLRDHTPAGDSRRRRAIAKLVAYGEGRPSLQTAAAKLLNVEPSQLEHVLPIPVPRPPAA